MWGGNINREQLLQKISLLAMLGPVRDHPKEHILVPCPRPNAGSSLNIDQEREIVSNLAFLSSRSKNSKMVVAIGIEEDHDGQGMVIRMAINGDQDVSHLQDGLIQISRMLEQISRLDRSEIQDRKMLLRQVVSGDFSRIRTRLQLGGRYNIATSRITRLYEALHDSSIAGIEHSKLVQLQDMATTVLGLFQQLKDSLPSKRDTVVLTITEELIGLLHNLNKSAEFAIALDRSSRIEPMERALIMDAVGKLGQYYKATSELVLAARRRRCQIFQRIRVTSFQTCVPENIRLPSQLGSALPLLNNLPETSNFLAKFRGSMSDADTALIERLNRSRSALKVHAEMKLLFYYETHPETVRPRIICANKSACYLCDLFLRVHGKFQTPSTYGKFNDTWILPDWLVTIPVSGIQHLRDAVEQLSAVIDSEIGLALNTTKRQRLPNPLESVVCLAAQWSNSTINNGPGSPYIHSTDRVVTTQTGPELDPGPSKVLKPTDSINSSSCTVLIPAPSLPSTSVSTEKDQSFILSFHDSYAVVSFHVAQTMSRDTRHAASWVRLGLLNPTERVEPNGGVYDNIVPLEDMQEDAEVEVRYGTKDSQKTLHIHWKRQIISIKYHSVYHADERSMSGGKVE
ncbi:MAG: hypothetical protein MMC33_008532 [Icmadophila ericetorum]|nr:hypothetical protein [Icmadophila ericetorum]